MLRTRATAKAKNDIGLIGKIAFLSSVFSALCNLIYFEFRGSGELFVVGSYHCNVIDIAVVFGAAAFLFVPKEKMLWVGRDGRAKFIDAVVKLCILFLLVIDAANLVRGLHTDPFKAFYFQRTSLFFLLLGGIIIWMRPIYEIRKYLSTLLAIGSVGIVAIFLLRVMFGSSYGIDIHSSVYNEFQYGAKRALSADAAVFISCSVLFLFDRIATKFNSRRDIIYSACALLLFMVVLASRQRTAIIAEISGIVIYIILNPRSILQLPGFVKISGILLFFGLLSLIFVLGVDGVAELFPAEFQQSATNTATLDARHLIWAAAIEQFNSWGTIRHLIGNEAGRSYDIYVGGEEWKAQLHNTYVGTLLQAGILGLVALIGLIASSVIRALGALRRRGAANLVGLSPQLGLAWLTIMLIYGYSYEWHNLISLFALVPMAAWTGLGQASTVAVNRPRPRPRPRVRVAPPTVGGADSPASGQNPRS